MWDRYDCLDTRKRDKSALVGKQQESCRASRTPLEEHRNRCGSISGYYLLHRLVVSKETKIYFQRVGGALGDNALVTHPCLDM